MFHNVVDVTREGLSEKRRSVGEGSMEKGATRKRAVGKENTEKNLTHGFDTM